MENYLPRAFDSLTGAYDELFPSLAQYLDNDALRNHILLDNEPDKIKVGLRCGREPDLNFFEAQLQQQQVHLELFVRRHGLNERLIAIPQIDTTPARRMADDLVWPGSVRQSHRLKGFIFLKWHFPRHRGFYRLIFSSHDRLSYQV